MNCDMAQHDIALLAYGELPDDERHTLEQHLSTCSRCQEELGAIHALQQAMSVAPVEEPSANLLARARLGLDEALDGVPRSGWLQRLSQSLLAGVSALGRAPVAASALLLCGIGLGGFSGFHAAQRNRPAAMVARTEAATIEAPGAAQPAQDAVSIANVSGIVRDPNSEMVEVQYNRLVPETLRGSMDSPEVRHLLMLAARDRMDPEIQQNSVGLLAEECRAGHHCSDGPVLKSLLVALRYDKNAGVRLKALNGLQPYVAVDMQVRDSVLEALMRDSDPAIRSRAIELLQPVQADSSVQEVLHTVASEDNNPHIRTVSREVLDQTPEIQ